MLAERVAVGALHAAQPVGVAGGSGHAPPVGARHVLGRLAESLERRAVATVGGHQRVDRGAHEAAMAAGGHEGPDDAVIRPAAERRGRDAQDARGLAEAHPLPGARCRPRRRRHLWKLPKLHISPATMRIVRRVPQIRIGRSAPTASHRAIERSVQARGSRHLPDGCRCADAPRASAGRRRARARRVRMRRTSSAAESAPPSVGRSPRRFAQQPAAQTAGHGPSGLSARAGRAGHAVPRRGRRWRRRTPGASRASPRGSSGRRARRTSRGPRGRGPRPPRRGRSRTRSGR